jgi:hypothetical protein
MAFLGLAANGEGGTPRGPRLSVTEATLAKAREGVALFHPASAFMKQWDLVTLVLLAFKVEKMKAMIYRIVPTSMA